MCRGFAAGHVCFLNFFSLIFLATSVSILFGIHSAQQSKELVGQLQQLKNNMNYMLN